MSEQPDSKDAGDNALDEAQAESVGGGGSVCDPDTLVAVTGALKQAYENLVDFTSHVIERVQIK